MRRTEWLQETRIEAWSLRILDAPTLENVLADRS